MCKLIAHDFGLLLTNRLRNLYTMRTRQQVTKHSDDQIVVKALVPRSIWDLIETYAKLVGVTPIQSWQMFLLRITKEIEAGNHAFLGTDLSSIARGLSLENKLGSGGMPPIDYAKLHRNQKLKSGYAGVYANGQHFRAMGPDGKYIGSYPSADHAAWGRYLYYVENNLAYGEAENEQHVLMLEIEQHRARFRSLGVQYTDEDLLDAVDHEDQLAGRQLLSTRVYEARLKFGGIDGTRSAAPVYADDGLDELELAAPAPRPRRLPPGAKRELTEEELAKIQEVTGGLVVD